MKKLDQLDQVERACSQMRVPIWAYDLSAYSLGPPNALLLQVLPVLKYAKITQSKKMQKASKGAFLHDPNLDSTYVNALRPYKMAKSETR
jgi:hypothetical protein